MYDLKSLADAITLLRGGLAVLFIWLGAYGGRESLPAAALLLVLCWTGDFVDGGLARRSRRYRHTWIGDHDLEFDVFVSLCLGIYLTLAGYVSLPWALGYAAIWLFILSLAGRSKALLNLVQALIYAAMIVQAWVDALPAGLLLVGWILAALVIKRERLVHQVVPEFLQGIQQAWHSARHC